VHLTPQGMDWTMDADDRTVALGSKVQLDALVGVLDKFVESEASVAQELRKRAGKLHRDLAWLILAFDEAISSRRLRKKCDLVPFF